MVVKLRGAWPGRDEFKQLALACMMSHCGCPVVCVRRPAGPPACSKLVEACGGCSAGDRCGCACWHVSKPVSMAVHPWVRLHGGHAAQACAGTQQQQPCMHAGRPHLHVRGVCRQRAAVERGHMQRCVRPSRGHLLQAGTGLAVPLVAKVSPAGVVVGWWGLLLCEFQWVLREVAGCRKEL
jgi:hypothetical protein